MARVVARLLVCEYIQWHPSVLQNVQEQFISWVRLALVLFSETPVHSC